MGSLSEEEGCAWVPLKRTWIKPSPLQDHRSGSEKGNDIWLLTLSDLLLLLAIFFVLLFGITLQQQQQKSPSSKSQPEPLVKAEDISAKRLPAPAEESFSKDMLSSLEKDLQEALKNEKGMEEVSITREAKHLALTFPESIVFDPVRAELKPATRLILDKVASLAVAHPHLLVEVQGHTDDRPINTLRYPSNWELSVDRATQVVKTLITLGLDPGQISLKGFGEYRRLYPNDSEDNRRRNRRVEIQFSLSSPS